MVVPIVLDNLTKFNVFNNAKKRIEKGINITLTYTNFQKTNSPKETQGICVYFVAPLYDVILFLRLSLNFPPNWQPSPAREPP